MLVLKIQEEGRIILSLPIDWEGDRLLGRLDSVANQRFQIGKGLGDIGKTISRTHATIRSKRLGDNYEVCIHDGTEHELSAAGVWIGGQRINGWTTLTPGIEVDLLKGYVLMLLQDQETDPGANRTYSPEEAIAEQVARLEALVGGLAAQLQSRVDLDAKREEIDHQQQDSLTAQSAKISSMQKRQGQAIQVGLIAFAVALIAPILLPNADPRLREIVDKNAAVIGTMAGGFALVIINAQKNKE